MPTVSSVTVTSVKGTTAIAPNEDYSVDFVISNESGAVAIDSVKVNLFALINNKYYFVSQAVSAQIMTYGGSSFHFYATFRSLRRGEACTSPVPTIFGTNIFDYLTSASLRSASLKVMVVPYNTPSMYQTPIQVSVSNLVAIRERINPSFTSFSFQRCDTSGTKNDEGERLLSNIRIAFANNAYSEFTVTLRLYSVSGSTQTLVTTVTIPSSDSRMTQLITGISNSTLFLSSFTVAKGTNYVLKGTISSSLESANASCNIAKSFANMHLSAATNGGVAFGSFSSSSNANPKFENNYPAYFYNALTVNGTFTASGAAWVGGNLTVTGALRLRNAMDNFKGGYYSAGSIAAGGDVTKNIGFGATFKSTPFTQICMYGTQNLSKISIQITAVSTSSMNVRIINSGSAAHDVMIVWMAFGIYS